MRHLVTSLLTMAMLMLSTPLISQGFAADRPAVRVGVLKFGTVNWELDTIKTHKLDEAEGIDLQIVDLASNQATQVALQGGAVDMIVTDWLWVSRQRADGADFTFAPYSTSAGQRDGAGGVGYPFARRPEGAQAGGSRRAAGQKLADAAGADDAEARLRP